MLVDMSMLRSDSGYFNLVPDGVSKHPAHNKKGGDLAILALYFRTT